MADAHRDTLGKVPRLTLMFWIIKIAATTLGETAGDAVSMSMNLGYLLSSALFAAVLLAAVTVQVRSRHYHPALYWSVIVATTTFGTTLADYLDRSLGIGYAGGAATLGLLLLAALACWRLATGSVSAQNLATRKAEVFYWITIMCSQTLGTALGDWFADPDAGLGLGYQGSALVFALALLALAAAYAWSACSRTALFWGAFILSRPLGAALGDLLDKPAANGGLGLNRYSASAWLASFIIASLVVDARKAASALRAAP